MSDIKPGHITVYVAAISNSYGIETHVARDAAAAWTLVHAYVVEHWAKECRVPLPADQRVAIDVYFDQTGDKCDVEAKYIPIDVVRNAINNPLVDGAIADREGWGLFECEGVYHLQRCDEVAVFASDTQALGHVVYKALTEGSEYHKAALLLVGKKVEF